LKFCQTNLKILITIQLLLGVCFVANAQFVFNYHQHFDSIAELTQKKRSELNYDLLLEKFQSVDTTMTNLEVLALMIGETKQDDYYPYELVHVERRILTHSQNSEFKKGLALCDSVLSIHPINFTALLERAYILDKIEDVVEEKKAKFQFVSTLDAVLSSGDGTIQYPIFVLSPMDGQILIRFIFGLNIGNTGSGEDEYGNFLDILEVINEEQGNMNMYFNIEHAVQRMFKEDLLEDFEKILKKDEKKNKKQKASN